MAHSIDNFNDYSQEWTDFVRQYDKAYATEEEAQLRQSIFIKNLREIERHNSQANQTYTKAVNQFSDLTQEEFQIRVLTPQLAFAPIPKAQPVPIMTRSSTTAASIPTGCTRGSSNCCISSANPNACCAALGMGSWNRRQCNAGSGNGVVPNNCMSRDSRCCQSSQNPGECCAALGFAFWDGGWCRGVHASNVPNECVAWNSHCCSESTVPQRCCRALGYEYYDGAFCRNSADWFPAPEFLENDYPKNFDWTSMTYRAVTDVKNQGSCGSCTFFAVIGALEAAYAIKHNHDATPLSEQQLIDCSMPNRGGCWASNFGDSLDYVIPNGKNPLASEADYPYQALHDTNFNPQACAQRQDQRSRAAHRFASKESYHDAWDTLNDDFLIRLVSKSPVAIAINADFMGSYGGGVYRGPCPPHVNHAVLLTGWGTDPQTGVPFWSVKNSWGKGWGENGFARFERKPGQNQCFIYHEVARATAL